jgi:hypothetical protein
MSMNVSRDRERLIRNLLYREEKRKRERCLWAIEAGFYTDAVEGGPGRRCGVDEVVVRRTMCVMGLGSSLVFAETASVADFSNSSYSESKIRNFFFS